MASDQDAQNSQPKSRGLPPHLIPGNPGNSGGKKGRSGRKPDAFKHFLARMRANPKVQAELKAALLDRNSRGYASALKLMADYDDDKPAEKKQIVGPVEVRVRIAREGRRITAG